MSAASSFLFLVEVVLAVLVFFLEALESFSFQGKALQGLNLGNKRIQFFLIVGYWRLESAASRAFTRP
jgi:hypothetical protein